MARGFLKKALGFLNLIDAAEPESTRLRQEVGSDQSALATSRDLSDYQEEEDREIASLFKVAPEAVSLEHLNGEEDGNTLFKVALVSPAFSLSLAVEEDLLTAHLVDFNGSPNCTLDDVIDLLRLHGLADCDRDVLEKSIAALGEMPCQEIVRGQAAMPGTDEQVHYPIFPDGRLPAPAKASFAKLSGSEFEDFPEDMRALWVEKNEILAALQPCDNGAAGRDIFGRVLPALPGKTLQLKAGPNVELSEDGHLFKATVCGYFFMRNNSLSVREPFRINGDKTEVLFAYIPLVGPSAPTEEYLLQWLEEENIIRGLDTLACEEAWRSFSEARNCTDLFTIARGAPPTHGRDAQIQLGVDCERKPGKILPDGSIDFREIQFGIDVSAGAVLARFRPATRGEAGFTVAGDELPAIAGAEDGLRAGEHVEVEEDMDALVFRSTIDGRVRLENGALQVFEVLSFDGDIDFDSGNVDFAGDVVVAGSVLANFSVKARGNIAVQGMVEAGAELRAEGDIVIGGGIVGDKTLAVAQRELRAKFVTEATVCTGGDLVVGSYLFGANVRSEGQVIVHQGSSQRSGTIAGGKVLAARGIQAGFAGSPNGTSTELIVGVDPSIEDSLRRCQQQLSTCQENLKRLHGLLGLEEITLPRLKYLLKSAAPQKRPELTKYIRQWQRLNKVVKAVRKQIDGLKENLAQPALQAMLTVDKIIYPGVKLRLGKRTAHVHLELKDTTLTPESWPEKLALDPAA